MQKNFVERKIDLSKRPLCDFFGIGNGVPIHEFLSDLRFYTVSANNSRWIASRAASYFEAQLLGCLVQPCHFNQL
jgi:hypothetical protein